MVQSCVRPYSTIILLDQQDTDTGAALALINFLHGAIGSIGMVLVVLPWPNLVVGLGAVPAFFLAVDMVAWMLLLRFRVALLDVKDVEPASPWF